VESQSPGSHRIEELEDDLRLEAGCTGSTVKDVKTSKFRGNELTISGEIKEREREGIVRRRARRSASSSSGSCFKRSQPGGVDAKLNDGVLTVRIPKAAGAHGDASRSSRA